MAPLGHVLWVGGPPGSGKTTVALRLARRHGLRWYGADTRTWVHVDRGLAAGIEAAGAWHRLAPAERWDVVDDGELLARSFHHERGPMVAADLAAVPRSPLVVAEGSTLPASEVDPERALWLMPTREFQETQLRERGAPPPWARLCGLLRDEIEREAEAHDVPVLVVDGSRSLDATVVLVERRFAAAVEAGPRATSAEERRALLREANEAVEAQVRGYFRRPWVSGTPDDTIRELLCECGDPACATTVERPLSALAAGPVIAPGHG